MEQHILAFLVESGPSGWAFVARTLVEQSPGRPAPSFTLIGDLEKRGYVERSVIDEAPNIVYAITDAGRDFLARFPPPSEVQRGPWLMAEFGASPPAAVPEKPKGRKKGTKK